MSLSAAELIRAMLGTRVDGEWDPNAMSGLLHQDVELLADPSFPVPSKSSGLAGAFETVATWEQPWDEIEYEIGGVTELGEELAIVSIRYTARMRDLDVDQTYWWVAERRDGLLARIHMGPDEETARSVAGDWSA